LPTIEVKKHSFSEIAIAKKMSDNRNEPSFKKKLKKQWLFLKKNRLPEAFTKKK